MVQKILLGDVIASKVEVYAEIGDVINDTKSAFREKTTLFKSLGKNILSPEQY